MNGVIGLREVDEEQVGVLPCFPSVLSDGPQGIDLIDGEAPPTSALIVAYLPGGGVL